MKINHSIALRFAALLAATLVIGGCVTRQPYDYAAFKESRPATILVLPPINNSPDVNATYSVMSQATWPLAESGYYVFPVTLVDETFKHNGLTSATDIHGVPIEKLRGIFGADAALLVPPKDTYAISEAMEKIYTDPALRSVLIKKGLAHAKSFSWSKAAREYLALATAV